MAPPLVGASVPGRTRPVEVTHEVEQQDQREAIGTRRAGPVESAVPTDA